MNYSKQQSGTQQCYTLLLLIIQFLLIINHSKLINSQMHTKPHSMHIVHEATWLYLFSQLVSILPVQ